MPDHEHDSAVRELAERVAAECVSGADYEVDSGAMEDHFRTFLAKREAGWMERQDRSATLQLKLVGQVAALRGALEKALARCPGCGGKGVQWGPDPGGSFGPDRGLDYPCPVCSEIRAVLAPGAGEKEAEVIRAVGEYLMTHRRDGSKSGPAWSRMAKAYDALAAVDALKETP